MSGAAPVTATTVAAFSGVYADVPTAANSVTSVCHDVVLGHGTSPKRLR